MAKPHESRDYESFIEDLTEKLEQWHGSDEPAHEFARRLVGLMRMDEKKWRERK